MANSLKQSRPSLGKMESHSRCQKGVACDGAGCRVETGKTDRKRLRKLGKVRRDEQG